MLRGPTTPGVIHTGRSRNDQSATVVRMYVAREAAVIRREPRWADSGPPDLRRGQRCRSRCGLHALPTGQRGPLSVIGSPPTHRPSRAISGASWNATNRLNISPLGAAGLVRNLVANRPRSHRPSAWVRGRAGQLAMVAAEILLFLLMFRIMVVNYGDHHGLEILSLILAGDQLRICWLPIDRLSLMLLD